MKNPKISRNKSNRQSHLLTSEDISDVVPEDFKKINDEMVERKEGLELKE